MIKLSKPVYYKNSQWAVTSYGLECLQYEYHIEKKRLWEDHPQYSWEQHMEEKNWVDLPEFIKAINFAYNKFSKLKPHKII